MDHSEMLSQVEVRFVDRAAAEAWYWTEALPGFSGRTAAALVQQGRADELFEYLEAIDAGVFA
jgi:hypothetical protein